MGSGGLILRVAYEVFVLTTGLPLLRFITSPASLVIAPGAPGSFNLIGLVAPDPPRGPSVSMSKCRRPGRCEGER